MFSNHKVNSRATISFELRKHMKSTNSRQVAPSSRSDSRS